MSLEDQVFKIINFLIKMQLFKPILTNNVLKVIH
jgi:hypothetical protein